MYEEEQRLRDEQRDLATKAEKKANELTLEVEEHRAQIDHVMKQTNEYLCYAKVLE